MSNVYLDTSFFVAALENQAGRQNEALNILAYEQEMGSVLHTSLLTLNEFSSHYYDLYREQVDCEEKIDAILDRVLAVAKPYAISDLVSRRAARILSAWGRLHGQKPEDPRDRHFRWDAIHLATAHVLQCIRVYAWDNKWHKVPKETIGQIGTIISPARVPVSRAHLDLEGGAASKNGQEPPAAQA